MTPAESSIRRVGIVFAGGPAPGANSVIAAATMAFRRNGREVVGFMNGYSGLQDYDAEQRPLAEGTDYFVFQDHHLRGLRNARGILVGTSRANPGKAVRSRADLAVSYTHLRAHETVLDLVCRLLLEKKKQQRLPACH